MSVRCEVSVCYESQAGGGSVVGWVGGVRGGEGGKVYGRRQKAGWWRLVIQAGGGAAGAAAGRHGRTGWWWRWRG